MPYSIGKSCQPGKSGWEQADKKIALNNLQNSLAQKINELLASVKSHLKTQLSACNPKSILNRGYSITKIAATGKIAKSIAEININDIIITEFKDEKTVESRVTKK